MVTLKQGYISKELLADLEQHLAKLGHTVANRFVETYVQRGTAGQSTGNQKDTLPSGHANTRSGRQD
jgi:hypothetical protein